MWICVTFLDSLKRSIGRLNGREEAVMKSFSVSTVVILLAQLGLVLGAQAQGDGSLERILEEARGDLAAERTDIVKDREPRIAPEERARLFAEATRRRDQAREESQRILAQVVA